MHPSIPKDHTKGALRWKLIGGWFCTAIVVILVSIYVIGALVISNSGFADSMTLCPTMYNDFYEIDLKGIKKQAISIPAAGDQRIDAWYFAVPGAKKLAIVNHGNAGNLSSRGFLAQSLAADGVGVLLFDYRGYGKSTGQATRQGILEDGLTVYTYAIKNLHYRPDQIIEFGESIGSTAACFVASQRPVAALMLQSPLDSLPDAGKWVYPILNIFPDFIFAAPHLDNAKLIKNIHAPIFIIHGKVDTTLRPEGAQILFDRASQPKTLVYLPNCGHTDMGIEDAELYRTSISKFIHALP